ncbi:MAG: hypothetical protein SGPRY_000299 [Prymnesium sp.]
MRRANGATWPSAPLWQPRTNTPENIRNDPAPKNKPADNLTDKPKQASRPPDLDEDTCITASRDPPDPPNTTRNPKARTFNKLDSTARKLAACTRKQQCKLPDGQAGNCEWERGSRRPSIPALSPDFTTHDPYDDYEQRFYSVEPYSPPVHWMHTLRTHSPHILFLLSGLESSTLLAGYLGTLDAQVSAYDLRIGRREHELTKNNILVGVLDKIKNKMYNFILLSPSCKSFSIALTDDRPRLRIKERPLGIPDMPPKREDYIKLHNKHAMAAVHGVLHAHTKAQGFEECDEKVNLRRGPINEELVYEVYKAIYGQVQSGLMCEDEH